MTFSRISGCLCPSKNVVIPLIQHQQQQQKFIFLKFRKLTKKNIIRGLRLSDPVRMTFVEFIGLVLFLFSKRNQRCLGQGPALVVNTSGQTPRSVWNHTPSNQQAPPVTPQAECDEILGKRSCLELTLIILHVKLEE